MPFKTDIPGWMRPEDLAVLYKLAGQVPENGSIIEFGCFLGRSTDALHKGKKQSVSLTVVDSFEINNIYPIDNDMFAIRLSEKGHEYVDGFGSPELYKLAQDLAQSTGSWEASFKRCVGNNLLNDIELHSTFTNSFEIKKTYDMVFIDASHEFEDVVSDIGKFIENQQTLIVGDDFVHTQEGVIKAILESRRGGINNVSNKRLLIVPENSKIWIFVPVAGYWRDQFKNPNSCFFE